MKVIYLEVFRALSDETRHDILNMLNAHEYNVNDICRHFGHMTQPTISHHLQILKRCNLVVTRRRGKMIYYYINKKILRDEVERFAEKFDIQIL